MPRASGKLKWYGGYNHQKDRKNEFGFIEREIGSEIYVHKMGLLCSEDEIEDNDGILLYFDVTVNPRNDREQASNVRTALMEMEYFIEKYRSSLDENNLSEIVFLVKKSKELLHDLPPDIKSTFQVFPLLTPKERLNFLLSRLEKNDNDETILLQLREEIQNTRHLITYIPAKLHKHQLFFPFLDISQRIIVWNQYLQTQPEKVDSILEEMLALTSERSKILDEITISLKSHPRIYPLLNSEQKLDALIYRYETSLEDRESCLESINEIIIDLPHLIENLPITIKKSSRIYGLLPALSQVEIAWPATEETFWSYWPLMTVTSRILSIYRASQEDINLYEVYRHYEVGSNQSETHPFVQAGLIIVWAKYNPSRSAEAFRKAHNIIENYIQEIAWDETDPLDMAFLLPKCKPRVVENCEGRPWHTEEDKKEKRSRATRCYCPRLGKECRMIDEVGDITDHRYSYFTKSGSHIYPLENIPWSKWSLHELLENSGITPQLSGLRSEEYVNKLSGWINRLNEIRSRLKCSVCDRIMRINPKYALNFAAYNATVFSCSHSKGHDKDIYFNHCWGCESQIIDSRESAIQVDGLYLCIKCGSGPQKTEYYKQGDVCPACGSLEISQRDYEDERSMCCLKCSHDFRIPNQNKLTGINTPYEERLDYLKTAVKIRRT